MRTVDTSTGTVWLDTSEFAKRQLKDVTTVYKWIASGFVVELGYIVHRDSTGHWLIGIPPQHQAYNQFR